MSKQNPIKAGDRVKFNVGDSAYFGPGRRDWRFATIDQVHASGNHRRYDLTLIEDGSKHYGVHTLDVKKLAKS